jgi:hypothetical protein
MNRVEENTQCKEMDDTQCKEMDECGRPTATEHKTKRGLGKITLAKHLNGKDVE